VTTVGRFVAPLLVAALAVAPALGAAPAVASKPAKAPKPKSARLSAKVLIPGDPYLFFEDTGAGTQVIDTTVNHGPGRAGPSVTKVYLQHGKRRFLLAERTVGSIGPHEGDQGDDEVVSGNHYPLGAYELVVCVGSHGASAKQSEPNCDPVKAPSHFYIAAASWKGTMYGTQTAVGDGELTEHFGSPDAGLDFDQYEGGGLFTYVFTGSVIWEDNGFDSSGCKITGSGEESFSHDASLGQLNVDYRKGEFFGGLTYTGPARYPLVFSQCPEGDPPPGPASGPLEHVFFEPTLLSGPDKLPWGSTSLPGSPLTVYTTTWKWQLERKGPNG
jgi:hypothetical protein